MANEHMRTAANNLVRALSDIHQYKDELRRTLDDLRRSVNERIKEIDFEVNRLRQDMARNDTGQQRTAHDNNRIRDLGHERARITQELRAEEGRVNQQLSLADQNWADIDAFAKRLQMIA